jgi:hypothetical protein
MFCYTLVLFDPVFPQEILALELEINVGFEMVTNLWGILVLARYGIGSNAVGKPGATILGSLSHWTSCVVISPHSGTCMRSREQGREQGPRHIDWALKGTSLNDLHITMPRATFSLRVYSHPFARVACRIVVPLLERCCYANCLLENPEIEHGQLPYFEKRKRCSVITTKAGPLRLHGITW